MSATSVSPPYELYEVEAAAVRSITPRLKRVTINAAHVPGLCADLPGQWLKVFIRGGDDQRLTGRAYTVRRYDPHTRMVDIDFVLHGDEGRISAWAAHLRPGEKFEVSAPHTKSGVKLDTGATHFILLGDETGLPAISAILESLPANTQVTAIVEIENAAEQQLIATKAQLSLRWLVRQPTAPTALAEAFETIMMSPTCVLFVAAESSAVAAVRGRLKRAPEVAPTSIYASGYWKKGKADHKDS